MHVLTFFTLYLLEITPDQFIEIFLIFFFFKQLPSTLLYVGYTCINAIAIQPISYGWTFRWFPVFCNNK